MAAGLKSKHNEAAALVAEMTTAEQAGLCSGKSFWYLKGVERLGLPSVMVTDGPHGLRKQASREHADLHASVPATCFPTAAALASSWDRQLLRRIGVALGEQCVAEDVAVILGPGLNIKRHPFCGRNFEYFSEDPLIAGEMAAAMVDGVQSQGVGTSVKHYAVNNQEFARMSVDVIVDERTLREIYLRGFEIVVKRSQPWTVMCAYNRVNGPYCGEHNQLLNEILRDEWGFEGLVVSDWGATNDRVLGVKNGLDLEMPGSGGINDSKIEADIASGTLKAQQLEQVATRVTSLALLGADVIANEVVLDQEAHHELAVEAAAQSAVLLKNDRDVLPLSSDIGQVAVIGEFARRPRYQGTGSSQVQPTRLDDAWTALEALLATERLTYAPGYDAAKTSPDAALIEEAVAAARGADAAVVFAGLPNTFESEGFDRTHLDMPQQHVDLIEAVSAANTNTVVVLAGGSPFAMPWLDSVAAVLQTYLPGQGGGTAAAQLLMGSANPCGKLAETFALAQDQVPTDRWFPGNERQVQYREGLYVGYRYFNSFERDVLFPFGHGLSYTTFEYSDVSAPREHDIESGDVTVRFSITNTGTRSGAEVAQLYVRPPEGSLYRPAQELKAFDKIYLRPGEIGEVELVLDARVFATYDPEQSRWIVPPGRYVLEVGASSRDVRARHVLDIQSNDTPACEMTGPSIGADGLNTTDAAFAEMLGHEVPEERGIRPYHINSTLREVAESPIGRVFRDRAAAAFLARIGGVDQDETLKRMFEEMANAMPLRSLVLLSGGAFTEKQVHTLLDVLNHRYLRAAGRLLGLVR